MSKWMLAAACALMVVPFAQAKHPSGNAVVSTAIRLDKGKGPKGNNDSYRGHVVRLDKEAQGMFANGVSSDKYAHRKTVMTNKKFTQWAMENNYMFAADKK